MIRQNTTPAGTQAWFTMERDTVALKSAPELVRSLRYPAAQPTIEHLRGMIMDQSEEIADAYRRTCHRDAIRGQIQAAEAAARLAEERERYRAAEAEREARTAAGGSWAKAAICAASVSACFAAEFV